MCLVFRHVETQLAASGSATNLSRGIILSLFRPRIEDLKASIRPRGQLQIIPRIGPGRIGNEFLSHVVRGPPSSE